MVSALAIFSGCTGSEPSTIAAINSDVPACLDHKVSLSGPGSAELLFSTNHALNRQAASLHLFSLDLYFIDSANLNKAAGKLVGVFAEQDLSTQCVGLNAGSQIHLITDNGVFAVQG